MTNRKRQPRGIPTGGEFAANSHDEAKGKLVPKINLSPSEVLGEAGKANDVYAYRMRLSRDERNEAMGETVLATQLHAVRGKQIDGALVNHIAKQQVIAALGKRYLGSGPASNMARTEFHRSVREVESTGVALSQSERDELAAEIRDNWYDQKHKPTFGYHREISDQDYDSLSDDDIDPSLIDPYSLDARLSQSTGIESDAVLERMEQAESIKERNAIARAARADIWRIVSSDNSAPPVVAKLSDASRKTIASHVEANGGAIAVARRYERGESDSATEALFMPFREKVVTPYGRTGWRKLSDAQMDSISDMLTSNSRRANDLWLSALDAAR